MKAYVSRLSLACDSDDPAVLRTFDERWSQELERIWSTIVVGHDEAKSELENLMAFATKLNDMIHLQFTTITPFIQDDVAAFGKTFDSFDELFSPAKWRLGTGGVHTDSMPVVLNTTTGEKLQWGLDPNGTNGFISVSSDWILADVQ